MHAIQERVAPHAACMHCIPKFYDSDVPYVHCLQALHAQAERNASEAHGVRQQLAQAREAGASAHADAAAAQAAAQTAERLAAADGSADGLTHGPAQLGGYAESQVQLGGLAQLGAAAARAHVAEAALAAMEREHARLQVR